ncbi:beta-1,3-N-acetylglucosaminyltransferase radical fringe-like [Paramacrobiotus metropolitanus]|uniref:beta-1,3-N-acetylglucosaminyltransferase radical fringe-like n=1 Tax=Paramacrobiotus metropolitanus TaxID=2943436 RepID=UPI0024465531|nr:beta-1,3-N-acetylglucosaminyltransferase radical fringe-like [Paramacrobiotus metropolitanus]
MRWKYVGRVLVAGIIAFIFFITVPWQFFGPVQFGFFMDEVLGQRVTAARRLAPVGQCPGDFADWPGNFVYVTVKTTAANHANRIKWQMQTWVPLALSIRGKNNESLVKVSLVSDAVDSLHNINVGGRMVKTSCPSSHNKTDLCCKMAAEFDLYLAEKKSSQWFCHVDDDNYVNIFNLLKHLRKLDSSVPLYIGKSSRGPTKLKDSLSVLPLPIWGRATTPYITFSFATGGAGFCLSSVAVRRIKSKISKQYGGAGLEALCRKMSGLADDVAIGYITGYYNITLMQMPQFHSHLEKLSTLSTQDIREAVTLSYTKYRSYENTVSLPPDVLLPKNTDPTRFLSAHKFLRAPC